MKSVSAQHNFFMIITISYKKNVFICIYILFLEKLCVITEQTSKSNSSKKKWKSLVLVIPLRLGISTINPAYVQGLKVRSIICIIFNIVIHYIKCRISMFYYFLYQ